MQSRAAVTHKNTDGDRGSIFYGYNLRLVASNVRHGGLEACNRG
jgi:hypothetical protein